jgi:anti-anti-sigma factor
LQGLWEAGGEIDHMTAAGFVAGMRCATDEAVDRDVLVDCWAATFMDCAAYHALVEARAYAIEQDHRLVIRNLQPNCARVLGLCDWDLELAYEGAS